MTLASVAEIEGAVQWANQITGRLGAGPAERYAIALAVEEVCANLFEHAYGPGGGPIAIAIARRAHELVLTICDRGPPFDPGAAPRPDLRSSLAERPIGGLGWHLVKRLMDEVRYDTGGAINRLTLVKRLTEQI